GHLPGCLPAYSTAPAAVVVWVACCSVASRMSLLVMAVPFARPTAAPSEPTLTVANSVPPAAGGVTARQLPGAERRRQTRRKLSSCSVGSPSAVQKKSYVPAPSPRVLRLKM